MYKHGAVVRGTQLYSACSERKFDKDDDNERCVLVKDIDILPFEPHFEMPTGYISVR
jgi:hypothetical protein